MSALDALLVRPPAPRAPDSAVARAGRLPPAGVQVLQAVHAGAPGPVPVLADAAVLGSTGALLGGVTGLTSSLCVLACLLASGRVYRDRDRVVARGVSWWPWALLPPVVAGTLLAGTLTPGARPAGALMALMALMALVALGSLLALRCLAWGAVARRRRRGLDLVPAVLVGTGPHLDLLARTLARQPETGLVVTGRAPGGDPLLLAAAAERFGAAHLLVAEPATGTSLRRALGLPVHVSVVPTATDAFLDGRAGRRIGAVAVLPLGRPLLGPGRAWGKRAVDVAASLVLLVALGPLLGAAALAVRLDDGGAALYRQRRTGRDGRPFAIVKLRTMRMGAERDVGALRGHNTSDGLLFKMDGDPRVTRVGALLRRTGFDELPQLLNVLRGEMSLVGPRPLPVEGSAFEGRDRERHLVRPGMTGLWQVSGGSTLRYREMVDLDLAYVHGWSHRLDARIALATIGVLTRATLRREVGR